MENKEIEKMVLASADHNQIFHDEYMKLIATIIDQENDVYKKAAMVNEVNEKLLWTLQNVKELATSLQYPIVTK